MRGSSRAASKTSCLIVRLALYQPDIPQNAGALIRLGACMGVGIDIIEPCGFHFSAAAFRRAAMDYRERAEVVRHVSWNAFLDTCGARRIVLLSAHSTIPYTLVEFRADDTLLLGRETAGVPDSVHERADVRVRIPLRKGLRSLNVAQAGAMVLGEALRQTNGFPL
jgi:tRNA (cytidine/uridine-2'-O-)-methyltransferase